MNYCWCIICGATEDEFVPGYDLSHNECFNSNLDSHWLIVDDRDPDIIYLRGFACGQILAHLRQPGVASSYYQYWLDTYQDDPIFKMGLADGKFVI